MKDPEQRIQELEQQVRELEEALSALRDGSQKAAWRLDTLLGDRSLLQAIPSVVNVLDRDHRIIYINRTIPNVAPESLQGMDARSFIVEADQAAYVAAFERAWATGTSQQLQVLSISGRRWDASLVPVTDGDQVVFMLGTSQDVTEQLANLEALRDSEAQLRHALAASGMGSWTYRIAEDRVRWDEATMKLFGVTADRAPNCFDDYLALVFPEDRAHVVENIQNYVKSGVYRDLEHRVQLPDGRIRHLLAKGTVLTNEAGITIGLRGGVFDITAQKELESQLQVAQKMQAIGQLTSGIAHNLNNVLSVIIPNAEECAKNTSGALSDFAGDIVVAAERAADMVRQLMLFSRPSDGGRKAAFDPNSAIQRIVDMCRETFDRRIRVRFEPVDVPPVLGNKGQIEQVLLNLCLNARDALHSTPRPSIEIELSETATGKVHIRVTDNGVGMDETTRARIFEPFFTTKEVGQGTGLGLASAYAILSDHDGHINCVSVPGQGTTFAIELPTTRLHRTAADERPAFFPQPSKSQRILVVDDEPGVRRAVVFMLASDGYGVTECSGGEEALAILAQSSFDLVLLDRSMPGMSGEQVAERIVERGDPPPIVLLTGDPGSLGSIRGVTRLLGKPIRKSELLAHLREVLDETARGPTGQ